MEESLPAAVASPVVATASTTTGLARKTNRKCRFCSAALRETFVDLGMSPLCESYVAESELDLHERFYPLHAFVCERCLLVQLLEYVSGEEIFREYAYFSSFSDSWLRHARNYADEMTDRLNLGRDSLVVEVASNDGYLLQYFRNHDVPVLGIEPARNVAQVAMQRGVPTRVEFFGRGLAEQLSGEGVQADLLIGNNVLAHVPDLNDFVAGLCRLLAPRGILSLEFPHLLELMKGRQFDTIYHEHFCYFSLLTAERVLRAHGLEVFDVRKLPTHGGSLRLLARRVDAPATTERREPSIEMSRVRAGEAEAGLERLENYRGFGEHVAEVKRQLLEFLFAARRDGKAVAGYGAPGKGNTLLNYCGIRRDLLDYTVDRNPYKQGKYLPGTRIPIYAPSRIAETRPDYLLILPWNLKDEIINQMDGIRRWGGRFVIAIPELNVV